MIFPSIRRLRWMISLNLYMASLIPSIRLLSLARLLIMIRVPGVQVYIMSAHGWLSEHAADAFDVVLVDFGGVALPYLFVAE